ncbi:MULTISPECIES: YheC/YheD family endospore coat-associated protein [Bacillus]|uniref:Endospore coat-associated protein n=2 Tax=Bacillus TaxID=1386 RepID=A0A0M4FRX4_9BACI|nr:MULTISPECIES: YheC/YheD family protein [Bacillus]ALC80593.1 endospore coat-associated protein [Bacillus gobiensis]MBP1083689.1 hypothetical protein [Bacillus capparidis]MED1094877.1 YheC/YheD family protein [Bacillus capparidis]
MTDRLYHIGILRDVDNTVLLPPNLKKDNLLYVAFGTKVERCHISFNSTHKETIFLSENIYKNLHIPYRGKSRLLFHEETAFIGPLIGIFTAGFTKSLHRPIGERSMFFSKLLTTNFGMGGFCYVFGSHQIQWDEGTVKALIFQENGWEEAVVPLPDVVYDRLPNRKSEHYSILKETKDRLIKEYQIPWFNPSFFNKWDIHESLLHDLRVSDFLPDTAVHPTEEKLEWFLNSYKSIYIKPANGSLGHGIFQITSSGQEFIVKHSIYEQESPVEAIYSSVKEFLNNHFQNSDSRSFIIQQKITLLEINHHPVDFRVHTNKNDKGEWTVTAIAAKIAGENSITTHISKGGVIRTLAEIYDDPKERIMVIRKLSSAALLLSQVIDEHIDGFVGEIGFDLGIDTDDKLWLFEANSRPGRGIFSHPGLRTVEQLTKRRNFEYAAYLSEQSILSPDRLWT